VINVHSTKKNLMRIHAHFVVDIVEITRHIIKR